MAERRSRRPLSAAAGADHRHVLLGRVPTAPGVAVRRRTRLHVVTGKGGTGKTTVAARPRARAGRRRPAGRCWSRSRVGRASPSCSTPRRCRTRSAGSRSPRTAARCFALAVDAEDALLEYLDMFYKLGRAGRALRADRRRRLRHHHRPGPARRPAHRQGLRGGAPQPGPDRRRPTTRSCWTRRRPGGSPGSSTSTPRSPGWPRCGPIRSQADAIMRLLHSPADRRPPGHPAGGDAGAGDRWTRSPSCARSGCRSAGWSSTWSGGRRCAADRCPTAAGEAGRVDRDDAGRGRARAPAGLSAERRPLVDRAARRGRRARRSGSRWRSASAQASPRCGGRRYELPLAGRRRATSAALLRAGRRSCARRGSARRDGRSAPPGATSTRWSTTRTPGSSSAAAPAGSARRPRPRRSALRAAERGRTVVRPDHRPGPPAGPVDGPRASWTTPRAWSRASAPAAGGGSTR